MNEPNIEMDDDGHPLPTETTTSRFEAIYEHGTASTKLIAKKGEGVVKLTATWEPAFAEFEPDRWKVVYTQYPGVVWNTLSENLRDGLCPAPEEIRAAVKGLGLPSYVRSVLEPAGLI